MFGLFGCSHKWEETDRQPLIMTSRVTPSEERIVGYAIICRCKDCGKPKLFKLRAD